MDWEKVKPWRKQARAKQIAARVAIPKAVRDSWTQRLVIELGDVLENTAGPVSFYWPMKAEPDLRPFMRALSASGITVALPVAIRLGEPMTFRPWRPGMPMERGLWNIPIPATSEEIEPTVLIAPFVGYDENHYRLGYGGGFFDRTLAKLGDRARAIGVGFSMFQLPTIHPQDHDLPMVRIVTELLPEVAELQSSQMPDTTWVGLSDRTPPSMAATISPLVALASAVPPELRPLVDYLSWQLDLCIDTFSAPGISSEDAIDMLRIALPTLPRNAFRTSLAVLLESDPMRTLARQA